MGDVQSKADLLRIVLHNDNDTPEDFVVELRASC